MELEQELESRFEELGIKSEHRESVLDYLAVLKRRDVESYNHCLRVAVLGTRIARHMHLDEKVLLFSGVLHDIGKSLLEPELLRKTEGFNERDMREMKKHPLYSYYLLRGIHEFSAEVILRHHEWQENSYPKKLPSSRINFSKNSKLMIDFYARILSLADFYDAITSRVNDKFGEKRKLSEEEAKAIMLMKNSDQRLLIEDLYLAGIFGNYQEKIDETQDYLYDSIWKDWNGRRTAQETRRYVVLACALEPLSEKIGCTTREKDCNKHLKLEYFIASAVNIGDAFQELAETVERKARKQRQPLIYNFAYKAQLECAKNRGGGRINQGIIEMLVPIVTSQMMYDKKYELSVPEVLEKAKEVLKETSEEDVQELVKMKKLAAGLSSKHDRIIPEYQTRNVYDYYLKDFEESKKLGKQTSIKHNEEFVSGFNTIERMYNSIMKSEKVSLAAKVEEAYDAERIGNHKDTGVGLTADCAALAIYLVLSHHPRDRVII